MDVSEYPGFKIISSDYSTSLDVLKNLKDVCYYVKGFEGIFGVTEQNWKDKIVKIFKHVIIDNDNVMFVRCDEDQNIDTAITFHPDAIVEVYDDKELPTNNVLTRDHDYIVSVTYNSEKTFIAVTDKPFVVNSRWRVSSGIKAKLYSKKNIFVQHV